MKKRVNILICLLALIICFSSLAKAAGDWETILRVLIDVATGLPHIESGKNYDTKFYHANFNFTITDQDGITNNFGESDIIDIKISGTGLKYTGDREGLVQYAKDNARELYDAIFPTDVTTEVGGLSDSQITSQNMVQNSILSITVSKKESKETTKEKEQVKDLEMKSIHSFTSRMEFSYATATEAEHTAKSIIFCPSYSYNFGEFLEHSVGIMMPFRYIDSDDNFASDIATVTFSPFIKFRLFEKDSFFVEEDNFFIEAGVHGILHTTFVSSYIFGGAGYFRYGGSLFAAAQWTPFENLITRIGIGYQVNQVYLPSSIVSDLVSDDFEWIIEALSDLPLNQDFVFGISFVVPITEKLTITLNYFRNNSIGSRVDSNKAFASNVSVMMDYLLAGFIDLSLGYKTVFEVENYEEHTLLIAGQMSF